MTAILTLLDAADAQQDRLVSEIMTGAPGGAKFLGFSIFHYENSEFVIGISGEPSSGDLSKNSFIVWGEDDPERALKFDRLRKAIDWCLLAQGPVGVVMVVDIGAKIACVTDSVLNEQIGDFRSATTDSLTIGAITASRKLGL